MLDSFPRSVLVTGCQRSGTTILARVVTQSEGMINYKVGKDDELDAALLLSGRATHNVPGRYCFQTTYLNECYSEYFEHSGEYKLIWMLRNPFSVVYSMMYNWGRFAFNELFDACGKHLLHERELRRYATFGSLAIGKLRRACLSYNGKVSQVFELKEKLNDKRLLVVDYDELVKHRSTMLPPIYEFVDLYYKHRYSEKIHRGSVDKAARLSPRERVIIEKLCLPTYERAKSLSLRVTESR